MKNRYSMVKKFAQGDEVESEDCNLTEDSWALLMRVSLPAASTPTESKTL